MDYIHEQDHIIYLIFNLACHNKFKISNPVPTHCMIPYLIN